MKRIEFELIIIGMFIGALLCFMFFAHRDVKNIGGSYWDGKIDYYNAQQEVFKNHGIFIEKTILQEVEKEYVIRAKKSNVNPYPEKDE